MNSIISQEVITNVKYDSIKYGIMFIIARILLTQAQSPLHIEKIANPIFAPNDSALHVNEWAKSALLVLIGFATYWVIIRNLVKEEQYVTGDLRLALRDLLYFGTMLVVSRLLARQPLDAAWGKSVLYVILGFVSYDVVIRKFIRPNINTRLGLTIDDTLRYTVMYALATWLADRHFNESFYKELVAVIVGLGVFNGFVATYV